MIIEMNAYIEDGGNRERIDCRLMELLTGVESGRRWKGLMERLATVLRKQERIVITSDHRDKDRGIKE